MAKSLVLVFFAHAVHAAAPLCPVRVSTKYVNGVSMSELFQPEDRIEVEEGWYACHEVKRGDVVLIQSSGRKRPLMKLAQVLPRDAFRLDGEGHLLVNEKPLLTPRGESYVFSGSGARMLRLYENSFQGRMPADTYFVFGTAPGGSLDSTRFGPVVKSSLLGRVRRKN